MCCFAQQHQFFLNAPSQSMKFSECNCASLLHQKLSFKIWSKCCNELFKILHQFLCLDLLIIQIRTRCLIIEGNWVTQSHFQISLVVKFCRTVYVLEEDKKLEIVQFMIKINWKLPSLVFSCTSWQLFARSLHLPQPNSQAARQGKRNHESKLFLWNSFSFCIYNSTLSLSEETLRWVGYPIRQG